MKVCSGNSDFFQWNFARNVFTIQEYERNKDKSVYFSVFGKEKFITAFWRDNKQERCFCISCLRHLSFMITCIFKRTYALQVIRLCTLSLRVLQFSLKLLQHLLYIITRGHAHRHTKKLHLFYKHIRLLQTQFIQSRQANIIQSIGLSPLHCSALFVGLLYTAVQCTPVFVDEQ